MNPEMTAFPALDKKYRRPRPVQAWLGACVLSMGLCSVGPADAQSAGAGLRLVELKDPVAGGPMKAAVFYPSTAPSSVTRMGPLEIAADKDAPWQAGRHPVVLLSHGNGGSMFSHHDTATALARQGFVVAAVEHPGDNTRDKSGLGTDRVLAGRGLQVSALLDFLLRDAGLAPAVDPARIGVAGFSAGGYTALVLAGARPKFELLKTYCAKAAGSPLCEGGGQVVVSSPPLVARADTRIRAAFVMSPVGAFFDADSLAGVAVPVELRSAADDAVLPAAGNASLVEKSLRGNLTRHVTVPSAGHFVFLAPCNPAMKSIAPALCTDPAGVDRQAVHDQLNQDAAAFFRARLPGPAAGH